MDECKPLIRGSFQVNEAPPAVEEAVAEVAEADETLLDML